MNRIAEILDMVIGFLQNGDFINEMLDALSRITAPIEWTKVLKVGFVLAVALLLTGAMFFANDLIFERYTKRRIKQHKLTVTNNGNTSSIFLLRTVELPKNLAIRFRVDGNPLIRVTYAPKGKEAQAPVEEKPVTVIDVAPVKSEEQAHMESLIPNLSDPLAKNKKKAEEINAEKAVGSVTKSITNVGKKAGFFASILSNVASLLPVRISGLQEAQASLKEIQQNTTQLTSAISTKTNTIQSLGDQLGKLPGADTVTSAAKSAAKTAAPIVNADIQSAVQSAAGMNIHEQEPVEQEQNELLRGGNFIYDEEVWNRNIGKVDDLGGSLNFFQTKILDPGESMKIDVEIMNLSDSAASISHLYKIEVVQIPQTRLPLTAPNRYVNGIVIFEKVSQMERLLPQMLILGLVIVSIQIIAGISYLLF